MNHAHAEADSSERGASMSEWIVYERLEGNTFDLPAYATERSSGMDLKACLVRPCIVLKNILPEHAVNPLDQNSLEKKTFTASPDGLIIKPNEVVLVPLGWKTEFSARYTLNIHIRSSCGIKGLIMANQVGIVDSDYRDELYAPVTCRGPHYYSIKHGDRIVQAILQRISKGIIKEGKVDITARKGGFGSTGVQ